MNRLSIIGLILLAVTSRLSALDPSITQLAVSVGSDWDATSGKLQLFERDGRQLAGGVGAISGPLWQERAGLGDEVCSA